MKNSISYCIPVCTESVELKLLLTQLSGYITAEDQIIVQGDQGNVSSEVVSVLRPYLKKDNFIYVEYPLNGDFATFKNNLLKYATKDWIFQIDADELVSETLLGNIKWIVQENPDILSISLPRVNIVKGLTEDWVKKWGWKITKASIDSDDISTTNILSMYNIDTTVNVELVNFPDAQQRLFQNNIGIEWINKVHEVLSYKGTRLQSATFPFNFDFSLFHIKELDRQIKQNAFYETL